MIINNLTYFNTKFTLNTFIMNLQVNTIPENWKPNNHFAFSKWYKEHVKSKFMINEDFVLINQNN